MKIRNIEATVFRGWPGRPVLVAPDYETFAQTPEARYLLAPERSVSRLPASDHLRALAAGPIAGRRFVLLFRE